MTSQPVEEFHFPTNPLRYRTIKNLHHFHQLLRQQAATLRRDVKFQSTMIPNIDGSETLNINCNQCKSFFKYMCPHKGENFFLRDHNEIHQHVLKQSQNCHQSILERIQSFLAQDGRQDKILLSKDICTNYRISPKEFQQLYAQAAERMKRNTLLYDGKEIQELIKRLKAERYTVIDDSIESKIERQKKRITKSIIIFNEQMTSNYKRYGQCCYIALDQRQQMNRWYVGAFLGVGRDMELSLFALFLVKTIDVDHIKGLMKLFFNSVENKPLSIITQYSNCYETAISQLKQELFLMSQHLIDYATYTDKLHQKSSKVRRIFAQLYGQPQKRIFFEKLGELTRNDSYLELDPGLSELVQISDRVCLSQIPKVPVAPYRAIKNKVTQKKSDFSVLKQFPKILYERDCTVGKHLYGKIKNLLKLLCTPSSDQTAEKSRIMDLIPSLKEIQTHVSKNVMDYLISKCVFTLHLRVEKIDDSAFKVFNGRSDFLKVTRKADGQPWACQCEQSIKTRLPCIHELSVCIKFNYPIDVQVARRWTNEQERIEEENRRKLHKKNKWRRTTLSEFLA